MIEEFILEPLDGKVRLRCKAIGNGSVDLSPDDVRNLIQTLGLIAEHLDASPTRFSPGGPYAVEPDPAWYVESEALTGTPLLHVRDQFFGWRHYALPRPEAARLGDMLFQLAQAPDPHLGKRPT